MPDEGLLAEAHLTPISRPNADFGLRCCTQRRQRSVSSVRELCLGDPSGSWRRPRRRRPSEARDGVLFARTSWGTARRGAKRRAPPTDRRRARRSAPTPSDAPDARFGLRRVRPPDHGDLGCDELRPLCTRSLGVICRSIATRPLARHRGQCRGRTVSPRGIRTNPQRGHLAPKPPGRATTCLSSVIGPRSPRPQ